MAALEVVEQPAVRGRSGRFLSGAAQSQGEQARSDQGAGALPGGDLARYARLPPSENDSRRLRQAHRSGAISSTAMCTRCTRCASRCSKSAWDALAELPRWHDLPLIPLGLPAIRGAGDDRGDARAVGIHAGASRRADRPSAAAASTLARPHARPISRGAGFKADRYSLQLRDDVLSA